MNFYYGNCPPRSHTENESPLRSRGLSLNSQVVILMEIRICQATCDKGTGIWNLYGRFLTHISLAGNVGTNPSVILFLSSNPISFSYFEGNWDDR